MVILPIWYHCRLEVIKHKVDYRGLVSVWDTDRSVRQKVLYFSLRNLPKSDGPQLTFYTDSICSDRYAHGQGISTGACKNKTGTQLTLKVVFNESDPVKYIVIRLMSFLIDRVLFDSRTRSKGNHLFVHEGELNYSLGVQDEWCLRQLIAQSSTSFPP